PGGLHSGLQRCVCSCGTIDVQCMALTDCYWRTPVLPVDTCYIINGVTAVIDFGWRLFPIASLIWTPDATEGRTRPARWSRSEDTPELNCFGGMYTGSLNRNSDRQLPAILTKRDRTSIAFDK